MQIEPDGAPRWMRVAFALGVASLAALPFLRAVGQPFVEWDDDVNFLLNPHFRGLGRAELAWMWSSFHAGHYMPVTWMTCALDFALFGLDPAAFHASSIAWHASTAALLYGALVELLHLAGAAARGVALRLAAAVGALAFAVHPLRAESVAWATERRDVVSGAFLALSLLAWLRARRPASRRGAWLALSIASFAASLLSKTSGLALPLVLLALDAWPLASFRRSGWRPVLFEKLPYLALALAGAALAYLGQRESTELLATLEARPVGERAAISAFAFAFYLRKTLWPAGLSPFYELPSAVDPLAPGFLAPLAFVVAASAALFALRRRSPALATAWTAWLAFALLAAPVIGIVHSGRQIAADRYTYLPSFAVAGALAAACARARRAVPIAAVALAALAFASWRQTGVWRDTRSVFERVVEVEPHSRLGHHKLGILAHRRGEHAAALDHYERALAAPARGGEADLRYDRAVTLHAKGERERALDDARAALAIDPSHRGALRISAEELAASGRAGEACELYAAAVARSPSAADLHLGLAAALLRARREAEALDAAARAAELEPSSRDAHRLQGIAALYLGRFAHAEAHLRRALGLGAEDAEIVYAIGLAVSRQGRASEARALFERVLALAPGHPGAREKLAR
jgi:tetratricopeptide (TPR) repeat protein